MRRFCPTRVLATLLLLGGWLCLNLQAEEAAPEKPKAEETAVINLAGISLLESIEETLEKQPNILIQREQTQFNKGVYREQSGQFDLNLRSSLTRSRIVTPLQEGTAAQLGTSKQVAESTDTTVALDKQFRSGIRAIPQAALTQNDLTADGLSIGNQARVDFTIQVPLLRGLGASATGAPESAARKNYEASLAALRFTASQTVFATATAYWNYVGAHQSLEVAKRSEERSQVLTEQTRKLVEGGERPPAEMNQLLANLADKTANRIRAEQTLVEARVTLGLAMGVPFHQINRLAHPGDPFPDAAIPPDLAQLDPLVRTALKRREDLAAFELNEKAAQILLVGARNGLLHRLDLNLSGGYSGLEEGTGVDDYLAGLNQNISGGNFLAAVRYEWPFFNSTARGRYLQADASRGQARIRVYDLERTISSQVEVAASALRQSALEVARSKEAVDYYTRAVSGEKEKLKLGMSTFIDVIDIEDRLLATELSYIAGQQRYAIALARLRFETGTLIASEEEKSSVALEKLLSVPIKED